jgi:hypothetical protein
MKAIHMDLGGIIPLNQIHSVGKTSRTRTLQQQQQKKPFEQKRTYRSKSSSDGKNYCRQKEK